MRKPFLVAVTGLALAACSGDPGTPPVDTPGVCDLDQVNEKQPGYPYDLGVFRSGILPDLQASCGAAGCHLAPNGAGTYNVFPTTEKECPDIQSFKAFIGKVSYENVAGSILLKNLNGGDPHTPPFAGSAITTEFTAFVQAAADLANPPDDQTILFSKQVFIDKVQPALDGANCATAGCHAAPNGILGFNLTLNPANPSAELDANFATVTSTKYVDQTLTDATQAKIYIKATDGHGGAANSLGSGDASDLESWVQDALDAANEGGGGGGGPIVCADKGQFNLDVFEDEIRPMLEGERDYNDLDGGSVRTGCARGPCHGDPSFAAAGKFYLKPGGDTEELIDSFRCFVNPDNPTNSQVLLCPLNLRGCRSGDRHPGEDIFQDVFDLNYQKLLSYIFAARAGNSPLDFAFFVRKINPIFSDPAACLEANTACADSGCHEKQSDGTADGGSNFPLVRDAFEDDELISNFISASNFVLFQDADQSSLVLYPTNEIADVDNNVLATGDEHPGGVCFDIDSQFSLDIQKFAGGLRPNGNGFLQDFLVAGVFPAGNVTDEVAPFDQDTVAPTIFESSGQSPEFNEGQWDGLFSAAELVNLFEAFPTAVGGANQLAYAVAFMINTTGNDLQVVVNVESENDLQLFADNQTDIGRDGGNASVTVTVPPFDEALAPTRILLKVFQKEGQDFAFTMDFADENGVPLTDASQELVFVLSGKQGGI